MTRPYKDPEKRRHYQRNCQRHKRAQKKLSNPSRQTLSIPRRVGRTLKQTAKPKAYICLKVPHRRLPGLAFKNRFFITGQVAEQTQIASEPLYGEEIFSWVLKP